MKKDFKKLILLITSVILLKFITAYSWGAWNFYPSNLLQNEWVVFGGIFCLTFAIVYLSLSQVFGKKRQNETFPWITTESRVHKGPVIVISLVIALFVAASISQRGYFYGYLGEEIGSWAIFFGILVMIALTIKVSYGLGKGFGLIAGLIIIWLVLKSIDPYYILPSTISYEAEQFYYMITSPVALGIIIVIGIAAIAYKILSSRRRY